MKDAGAVANLKGVCSDSIWKEIETRGGAKEEHRRKNRKLVVPFSQENLTLFPGILSVLTHDLRYIFISLFIFKPGRSH